MAWYHNGDSRIVWAEQWRQGVNDDLIERVGGTIEDEHPLIPTPRGEVPISSYDWIVTGVCGDHDICKPHFFMTLYELVQE